MQYNREPHKVYSLIYHLIFVVKYRQQVFLDDIGIIEVVKENIQNLSKNFDVNVLEIECGSDDIHLLISAKPTLDIPKYINTVKGLYFIATMGTVSIDILKHYIEDQRGKLAHED